MNSIIFISAPGAGKGTISKYIEEKYNMNHISTGDLLREEMKNDSPLSKEIKDKVNKGLLVDDELLFKLLENKLQNQTKDFILDGTPRNLNQAVMYDELTKKLNINILDVIYIDVLKEVLEKRVTGRLICKDCNSIFNKYLDNELDGICDKCGGVLFKRKDDEIDVFENRYNTFISETKPLKEYYNNKNILKTITNNDDIENTYKQIDDIFKEIITGECKNGKE